MIAEIDSELAAAWCDAAGTWFAAIGTIGVAIVAFFPDWVRGLILRPKCVVECGTSDIYFQQFFNSESGDAWRQVRLRIRNDGNAPALGVEVHLLSVTRIEGSSRTDVPGFVPVRLKWSHGSGVSIPHIAPETGALVDFGTMSQLAGSNRFDRKAQLSLCAEVAGTTLWQYEGGTYHFQIGVVTSSGYLRRSIFEVSFADKWLQVSDRLEVSNANFSINHVAEIACGHDHCGCKKCC